MFEITKGVLGKYDIAAAVIKPPLKCGDIVDAELLLISKVLPGQIRGHLTIDKRNNYNPRSYTNDKANLSQDAKRELRVAMKQLLVQLRGESSDV